MYFLWTHADVSRTVSSGYCFSFDIFATDSGNVWLIEINSKIFVKLTFHLLTIQILRSVHTDKIVDACLQKKTEKGSKHKVPLSGKLAVSLLYR